MLGHLILSAVLACSQGPHAGTVNPPQWYEVKPSNTRANPDWGVHLTDIEQRLTTTDHRLGDKLTWAHEGTHFINANLTSWHSQAMKTYAQGLYVGGDRCTFVLAPKITVPDIARIIPLELRGSRYKTYLVDFHRNSLNTPTMILDEWVAYQNGLSTGIEHVEKRLSRLEHTNYALSVLEMSVYSAYMLEAADPDYDATQLKAFVAWGTEQSFRLHRQAVQYREFNWDSGKTLAAMQTGQEYAAYRRLLVKHYDQAWVDKVLGITQSIR